MAKKNNDAGIKFWLIILEILKSVCKYLRLYLL